ncbi:MAG: hypothetical protein ACFE8M_07760 [Candidatus Hermodarchaeota archaeon]
MENQYARQRMIKDITVEDSRIQVTAYVKEILDDNFIILDDKTGEIKVNLKDVDFAFNKDDLVNVFGFLDIKIDGEKEIEAEIIQDMTNLNFAYYQKIYEIKKTLI